MLAAVLVAATRYRRVQVHGPSMEPTLRAGDRLLARRPLHRRGRWPRVGDVVVVRLPGRGEAVKRVAATAGQPSQVGGAVRRLGAGEVAVVGDRPELSTDSRHLGPLPLGAVRAVVVARYHPPGRVGGREALAPPGPQR